MHINSVIDVKKRISLQVIYEKNVFVLIAFSELWMHKY